MEFGDHLFRRESGRMVAALTRIFGVHNLALAEDVVQDAFCRALETWRIRGLPENPSGWLMTTAKNAALDVLRRQRTARNFAPELGRFLTSEWTLAPVVEELFAAEAIKDDLLRMMFSCCQPCLPEGAQIALILHILCGFSVDEVANAFVSSRAAVEKRIMRAKKLLATSKELFDTTTPAKFAARLPAVQRALYLLFNEGYHGASAEAAVRAELCREALRLAALLLEHPLGKTPATYALAALMCLGTARLPARIDASGGLIALLDQDRSRWDPALVTEWLRLLELSASGAELTEYHLEAAIASMHACASSMEDTDWRTIVSLYNALLAIRPSPIVALNRAIAIAQSECAERGLDEIRSINDSARLGTYRSTLQRSASSSCGAAGMERHVTTFARRSLSHAIRWSAAFSPGASRSASEILREGIRLMCRNIKTLHNFKPPASEEEIRASALQFVRKLSGFTRPSKPNQAAFDRAVDAVATAARDLLASLVTTAPPRDREVEASKARARAADRFGSAGRAAGSRPDAAK